MTGETELELRKTLAAIATFVVELTGLAKELRGLIADERADRPTGGPKR